VRKFIKGSNSGLDIVFDQGVPIATSNYTALLEAIRAASPDAVVHFGYVSNDVAFASAWHRPLGCRLSTCACALAINAIAPDTSAQYFVKLLRMRLAT
jgi:hypothetical protein